MKAANRSNWSKWTHIDAQKNALFVAVSKSGRSRTIVLSKKALDLLEKIKSN